MSYSPEDNTDNVTMSYAELATAARDADDFHEQVRRIVAPIEAAGAGAVLANQTYTAIVAAIGQTVASFLQSAGNVGDAFKDQSQSFRKTSDTFGAAAQESARRARAVQDDAVANLGERYV